MRVVNPQAAPATTGPGTRTLTGRILELRPSRTDLVDAALLLVLGVVALAGFATTFATPRHLAVSAAGLVLGLVAAHVTNVLRWHWAAAVAAVPLVYFVFGGPLAVRDDLVAGVLPTGRTLAALAQLSVTGWKDMLTTLPPLDGDGVHLALPFLLAVAAGSIGFAVARRTRSAVAPVAVSLALLAAVVLLGTFEAALPVVQGVGWALVAFLWLLVRYTRRKLLAGTGRGRTTRWVAGAALLAVALGGGVLLADRLPGATASPRFVLRAHVQPPVEVDRYPSPLAGFRKYATEGQPLYDQPLLHVEGAPQGTLLRFAVLDDYTGTAWSAAPGVAGDARTGFQRIGAAVPGAPEVPPVPVRLTIRPGYASATDLNVWLPGIGPTGRVEFSGPNADDHAAHFRYNLGTQQGLVPDRLKAGDVVELRAAPTPTDAGALPRPDGAVVVPGAAGEFTQQRLEAWGSRAGDPWGRLMGVAAALRDEGSWTNGTLPGERMYLPGHGQRRLTTFLDDVAGSDEQYAAVFALMANRVGYPARVVLGASVPADGEVTGRHVKAWVELRVAEHGWVAVPTDVFTPDRSKKPSTIPPQDVDNQSSVHVPPPNPAPPPGSFDSLFNVSSAGDALEKPRQTNPWWLWLAVVGRWVGPPLGVLLALVAAVLGAKAWRVHRRRTRGAASTRVAAGWLEYLDRARDLGRSVPPDGTRLEQAAAAATPGARELAADANRLVFGASPLDATTAAAFWNQVAVARREALAGRSWWRRLVAALNPRSLVPLARDPFTTADAAPRVGAGRRVRRGRRARP